jgi:hypothetical protein
MRRARDAGHVQSSVHGSRVSGQDDEHCGSGQHTTVRMHFRASSASDRGSRAKVNDAEREDGEAAEQGYLDPSVKGDE